jgi:hypothetical protein
LKHRIQPAGRVSDSLSDRLLVLDYARGHGSINRGECESLLGVKATRATYLL